MTDHRTRIVEVAAEMLREHGTAAVTTRSVAEGAGVQAPTIYRLFGDKDGLLDAVAEHAMSEFAAAKADAVRAADGTVDPIADLRAGWDMTIDFGLANPDLFVIMNEPSRARRSEATRNGIELLARRIRRIAAAGLLAVPERRAVDLVHAAGTGAVLAVLSAPEDQRDRSLTDAAFSAVLHQITVHGAGPAADPDPVRAAAVTLRAASDRLDALTAAERTLFTEWLDRIAR